MTLLENNTKLLISDPQSNQLHLLDLDGNILKSFNPCNLLKRPSGVCVLNSDTNEERIFIGDSEQNKIFVFDSKFYLKLKLKFSNGMQAGYMRIDNEFNKSRLYVCELVDDKITIWDSRNGKFINSIDVEAPKQIFFTLDNFYVSSAIGDALVINNKVIKINKGGNCIFEIEKRTLEIKRRIIGNWYSPHLLTIESNGIFKIAAYAYDENLIISKCRYLQIIDQNGKIVETSELNSVEVITDTVLVNNKIFVSIKNKLKIFE
jgi:WD40 repeat protein